MLHNPYNSHYFEVPHPHTPYHGDIPSGVVPGKQFFITGEMTGTDFAVNFEFPGGKAFHFNPRAHMNYVVRNSEVNGGWGPEETDGPMPFHPGQHFEIIFKCEHDKFLIAVNGQHCFEYNHRVSFHEISHLSIVGHVHVQRIVFAGAHGHHHGHHHGHDVPFSVPIHGVHPGKMIQILGHVPSHCGRFEVNLQRGGGHDAHNVALHFSARFDDPYDGQVVVVTNRQHGGWGQEIRNHEGGFPFHHGHNFEMLILVEEYEFKVAVNGRHFTSMGHRNPLHDGDHLHLEGDVQIRSIKEF